MQCRALGKKFILAWQQRPKLYKPADLSGFRQHLVQSVNNLPLRDFSLGRLAKCPLEESRISDDEPSEATDNEQVSDSEQVSDEDLAEAKAEVAPPPLESIRLPIIETKIWEDDAHPIRRADIPKPAWTVLLKLRAAGHEGYVVGGAVRDLLIGRQPKDFDILTTATSPQVRALMKAHRARIVGRRFPIVLMQIGKMQMEVSSFATNAQPDSLPLDAFAISKKIFKEGNFSEASWSEARRWNAQTRDFTVNALLYDPFSSIIYDYTKGVADCKQRVLRTIVDPEVSFAHDPARMLRAIRHAARSGLKLHNKTAAAIAQSSHLLEQLQPSRLTVELHSLLAYGSSVRSVQLLWEMGLLTPLFPELADYLTKEKYPRNRLRETKKGEELFKMLSRMDRQAGPAHPLPSTVWQLCLVDFIATNSGAHSSPGRKAKKSSSGSAAQTESNDLVLSQAQRERYIERTGEVLGQLIDRGHPKLIARGARAPLLSLLRQQLDHRLGTSQTLELRCRGCKQVTEVPSSTRKTPICECGRPLPTKTLRNFRSPEFLAIIKTLQSSPAREGSKEQQPEPLD